MSTKQLPVADAPVSGETNASSSTTAKLRSLEQSAQHEPELRSADLSRTFLSRVVIGLNVVIVVYWATMFVATHAPIPQVVLEFALWDKLEHFCAYGLLALLLSLRRVATGTWGRSAMLNILLITGSYGVVDEITQIPVGRQCDLVDWIADMCGLMAAIGCVTACRMLVGARDSNGHAFVIRSN